MFLSSVLRTLIFSSPWCGIIKSVYVVFLHVNSFESPCRHCCGPQIRPVEEQLKQRVIGKRYCISRKGKSYKGSTSRAQACSPSVKYPVRNEKLPPFISCNFAYKKAQGLSFWGEGEGCALALTMFTKGPS